MTALVKPASVTAAAGVHGSASTWMFNILRELMIAQYGADKVHALFADSLQRVLEDPRSDERHVVWKLHWADTSWRAIAATVPARVILTVRDPRDAMLSMMQRFGTDMAVAGSAVLRGLQYVASTAAAGHPVLRYEDHFFGRPATVGALVRHFGLSASEAEQARIFASYTSERVRAFGLALDALPPERIRTIGTATRYDEVTHIHRTHIGDQRVGKWRDQFNADQRRIISAQFTPFLPLFGYATG